MQSYSKDPIVTVNRAFIDAYPNTASLYCWRPCEIQTDPTTGAECLVMLQYDHVIQLKSIEIAHLHPWGTHSEMGLVSSDPPVAAIQIETPEMLKLRKQYLVLGDHQLGDCKLSPEKSLQRILLLVCDTNLRV
jgi:hypothetical protein